MYFTYGIGEISKEKFKRPYAVSKQNKIQGGLWCCPKNEVYSDWFVLTLACPQLVRDPVPYDIEILSNAKILKLTQENINLYTDSNKHIDFEKIKEFDVLHFTKELVENVKEFEAYYVESIQILNFDIMTFKESYIDEEVVLSNEFREKMNPLIEKILNAILKTDVFQKIKNQVR
ncbi:hypothetical protein KGF47_18165 [Clostridioides sp. ZZV13-5731]|uniref:hypothetical protein n=1 Tax=Clostridioides sp. ZZV13-5731 TaxID=2811485 RepID=UPI001D108303|nr:hypothetical protein [Clostridioides sp. ZZV13-5731]